MAFATFDKPETHATSATRSWAPAAPSHARLLILLVIALALAAGVLASGPVASARAMSASGADLTRLLRAMAAIKALMAAGVAGAVLWRLGAAVSPAWLAAYAAACAAMAMGPGLIWSMAHIGMGALFLHAGLVGSVVLLWRDPVVTARLAAMVAARRAQIASRGSA
jgi:hypothetical protein